MKTIIEDLKAYLKTHKLTQQVIADRLGVKQPTIASLLSGKRKFTKQTAALWECEFGISAAWLMTGQGEMLVRKEVMTINNHDSENHIADNHGTIGAVGNDANVQIENSSDNATIERLLKIIERQQHTIEKLMNK